MSTTRRSFPASADDVFAAILDAPSYPRWLVGAKQVLEVDEQWPAPGSGFRHRSGAGPVEARDRTTVTSVDPAARTLELVVRARPFIEADVRFDVRPDDPGQATLTMTETPRGPFRLLTLPLSPLLKLRNDRSLDRLADVVRQSATRRA